MKNNFFFVIIIVITCVFIYFDITSTGDEIYNTLRFITYGIFINLVTSKVVINGRDKETVRVADERNLLQELLLKKERISSQKLNKAIRRASNKNSQRKKGKK